MEVYFNGSFMAKEEVRLSPDDRGFLFADGVYEVVRTYHGKLFRGEEHYRRLERSLREVRMGGPGVRELLDMTEKLLARNAAACPGDMKVYVQITRGAAPRAHAFPDPATTPPTVYAIPSPVPDTSAKCENGVGVVTVADTRWTRCDIKVVGLLPNVLALQTAKENGCEEAIFVRDGMLMEGSHTNFMAVVDGSVVTAPFSNYILPGITREVVLELCRDLRIPVEEFPLTEARMYDVDELMVCGTISEVMPVVRLNGRPVSGGKPGPVTRKLQAAFREFVR